VRRRAAPLDHLYFHFMALSSRNRDSEREALERNSFIVLQHLHAMTGGNPRLLGHLWRLGDALGMQRDEVEEAADVLAEQRFCTFPTNGPLVAITTEGVQYLEHDSWRRRSVRAE